MTVRSFIIVLFFTALLPGTAWAEWVSCGSSKVWVQTPSFEDYGLRVYSSGTDRLVFIDAKTEEVRFCIPVQYGSILDGFFSFSDGDGSDDQRAVFAVRDVTFPRYYDIESGQEVYVDQAADGSYFVSPRPREREGTSVTMLNFWHSQNSLVIEPEYHKILSSSDWERLWIRHRGQGSPVPRVEFRTEMLVAILCGRQVNSTGIEIVDVRELPEEIVVYFRQVHIKNDGGSYSCTPTGFLVLPRSGKRIVLKEEMYVDKGLPLRWVSRAAVH
ncbi:MAG: hypothetical protein WC450_07570 [Candidatus Omnitrophota bacterium]